MRPSNKRSRNKQNRPRTLGNIVNRVFDSSGPEGKVRGTPQQIIDKYTLLARDAQLSGDRVAAENFLQHSEHYTRMLNEAQAELAREAEQRGFQNGGQGQNGGQNGNPNGQPQNRRFDPRDDDGLATEADYAAPPRSEQPRPEQPRAEQPRQEQPRSDQPRSDQPREGRNDWKERRNKRFDERRARRETTDPRGEGQPEADSMLVETPEQRAEAHPALAPIAEVRSEPVTEAPPSPAPESAEAAPAKPPRRPRKPRAEVAEAAPAPDAAE